MLLIFVVVFVILVDCFKIEDEAEVQNNASIHPGLTCGALVCCVLLMTFIFAALDNIVTYYHAKGAIDVGEWPRLLLALSGILAGILFDLKKRRYMSLVMYCVTVLSVLCILLIGIGGSILAGLLVFYPAAGFSLCSSQPVLWKYLIIRESLHYGQDSAELSIISERVSSALSQPCCRMPCR